MSAPGSRIGCGCIGQDKENVVKIRRSTYEEIRTIRTEEIRTEQYSTHVPHRMENVRRSRAPLIDVNDRHLYAPVPKKLAAPTRVARLPTNIKPVRRVIPQPSQSYTADPHPNTRTYNPHSIPRTTTIQRPQSIPSNRTTTITSNPHSIPSNRTSSTVKRAQSYNPHSIPSNRISSTIQGPSQTYTKWPQDESNSTETYNSARSALTESLGSTIPDFYLSNNVKVERGDSYDSLPEDETEWATFRTNHENVGYGPGKVLPRKSLAFYREPLQTIDETPNQMVINDGVPSLRKKTLRRSVLRESEYLGIVNLDPYMPKVHPLVLYSEYMDDIILNALKKEEHYTLEPYFIKRFNLKQMTRAAVVNWLIKLQQYFSSDSTVFFTSVRLMDTIISIKQVSENMLQLFGMVCFWIACKMGDIIDAPNGSALLKLCNFKYKYESLLKVEHIVLFTLKFDINVDEPMLFVRYYLYQMKLENCNIVSMCSNYLLDLFMLDPESNTIPVSLQAASAVFLSVELLNLDHTSWFRRKSMPGYHSLTEMTNVHHRMLAMVRWVHRDDCKLRDIYQKYATEKYGSISLKLHQTVV